MEMYQSAAHTSTKNLDLEDVRRSVTYHPNVWGDYFLAYASDNMELSNSDEQELQKLREDVRKVLVTTPDESLHKLELIDSIQRLGVAYHFEKEIDISLKRIYETYSECNRKEDDDLYIAALCFRLLRQQGYNLSSADVFNKFLDHEGKFEESLTNNVQGILSLYEAAHCRVHGEEILENALGFSSSVLESRVHDMSNSLAAQVNEALQIPIRKSLTRFQARKFMSVYQENESHNEILLNFAKLDFNFLQKINQKELSDLTRWWNDLDFKNKLPFARDRMVECYFWILGIYFEPQYQRARKILSKVIVLASTMDDIYDVYGTLPDLQLFTDAIQRWDIGSMVELPPYMRVFYKALLDVYDEMEELEETGKSYRARYAREEMKKLAVAYFEEAKWLFNNHIPTMEEYMKVAVQSSGYIMVASTSLVGMGNLVTIEDFDWISGAKIVRASAIIARLMDDMAGFGFEKKFDVVECYIKEKGASKEEAFDELENQVSKAWKDINQECLYPTAVSMPILMRMVNSASVIHLLYKDGDGYTNSKNEIKELIKYVLVEPVAI
ncbi:hypothetical protein BUALT_Bualt03G0125800 [Buddleja alternifolia]|uniref:Uncharacterized protein n=1 Tax=Buddleja alternifolia TaxID=168488 RepID=A0AAV6Y419_9LAMI|nr:hypothetical protein BUALT_Bualt03G0125600 [Buddleja alternifolia]KAG8386214.1 hypothetical protein BUALT_Bualt03G0125700 [Buddleja alternifolia]KAG8386215.1 hypothetical protein BUALT_Bualt03G0125800 [Buddleja alternifolia]